LLFLASFSQPGFCSSCGGWLGLQTEGELAQKKILEAEDAEWIQWGLIAVGELLGRTAELKARPTKETIAQLLTEIVNNFMAGNNSKAARYLGVSDVTILDWKRGKQIPQLGTLLRLCYQLDIVPFDFLTRNGSISMPQPRPKSVGYIDWCRPRKTYRKFEATRIEQVLMAELYADNKTPRTMVEIAKELDYDPSHIYKHFAQMCKETTKRHQLYRYNIGSEKKRQKLTELQRAIDTIHSQGDYPSLKQVAVCLKRPGYLRHPEAYNFWRRKIKDLVYTKF